ncbi:SigE family RNA polymerase sigma factor [uncultured Cellulomonas sp.]|uniref:SigE family RNA polymerase sigma factor n=1 Tax=uncultured Cellulomonas sp. TaxID=189682 RepID=UPI002612A132|nr:SigE family RNA polymerase sigma factor [uncultured Cellulomonas sp.]
MTSAGRAARAGPATDRRSGDETLAVESLASGRREEFTAFMADSRPALGRLALFLSGDRHRAEDLLQHTHVRTYAAWPRIRAGDPHAYARRVMSNHRIDTWRRTRREDVTDPADMPHTAAPGPHDTVQERDRLVTALRQLPVRRRRAVVLRYLFDLPERQVAELMGVSIGTVKSTAARGLAQLRESLHTQEVET